MVVLHSSDSIRESINNLLKSRFTLRYYNNVRYRLVISDRDSLQNDQEYQDSRISFS